jgi:hypothetical protein
MFFRSNAKNLAPDLHRSQETKAGKPAEFPISRPQSASFAGDCGITTPSPRFCTFAEDSAMCRYGNKYYSNITGIQSDPVQPEAGS